MVVFATQPSGPARRLDTDLGGALDADPFAAQGCRVMAIIDDYAGIAAALRRIQAKRSQPLEDTPKRSPFASANGEIEIQVGPQWPKQYRAASQDTPKQHLSICVAECTDALLSPRELACRRA